MAGLVRRAACAALVLGGATLGVQAAGGEQRLGQGAITLPLRVVDGHLTVGATVYNRAGASDGVSFEIGLDYTETLTIDDDQLGWLNLDTAGLRQGKEVFAKVAFVGGPTLLIPAGEVKAERSSARGELHNRLTRQFGAQLEERKLKGVIGVGFLRHYGVKLDFAARTLSLTPTGSAGDNAGASAVVSAGPSPRADFLAPFELRAGRIVISVSSPAGAGRRLVLGSSNYDTFIDAATAKRLERPNGDVAPVTLLGAPALDLAQLVAFRPGPVVGGDDVLILSGVNFLEPYRVEIDWSGSILRLTAQAASPAPAAADRAFYAAENAGTTEAFLAFLKAQPKARHAPDAANRLLALRLEEWGVADADVVEALQWVADTALPERRLEACLGCVNRLAQMPGKTELTIQAALLGLKHARGATNPQDAYRLHRILGEQYLAADNLDAAWRHLLSAGFVTLFREPQHTFLVALNLARVYEKQGRLVRAYSRYKAALAAGAPMTADVKKEITAAIERLKAKIPPEQLQMLDT